jgi:hypothetical protein
MYPPLYAAALSSFCSGRRALRLHTTVSKKIFPAIHNSLDSRSRTIYIVLQERVALRRNRASRPDKGAIHEEESQEGRQESP